MKHSRRAALAVVFVGSVASAAEPTKTYPLAAKSLVLDAARAGDALVAVGDRGFILRSTDDGAAWTQVASPVATMLTSVHMIDTANGWAVGHDAVILSTTDGGLTWTEKFEDAELETPLFDVWFEDARHGIAVGGYGLIQETRDGGATWEERRISDDEPHLYTIDALPDGTLITLGEMGSIFTSADKGATWTSVESPYEGTFFGALVLKDGGVLIYGLRGNLFRSDDAGKTWMHIETGVEASLLGAAQRTDGSVVVVGLSGTLLASADGRAFTASAMPEREALGGAIETPSGRLLLFGERGAYPASEMRR